MSQEKSERQARLPYEAPRITETLGDKQLRELLSPHGSLPDYSRP